MKAAGYNARHQAGALALILAAIAIVLALVFEHFGGFEPCPLCLMQRWTYYAGIPMLFVALVLNSTGYARLATALFLLVALGFLANAGLGLYHAGVEWKFWAGPTACHAAGGLNPLSSSPGGLLESLEKTRVIRCDEAQGRWFGLSFAGWNAAVSAACFLATLRAAFAGGPRRA